MNPTAWRPRAYPAPGASPFATRLLTGGLVWMLALLAVAPAGAQSLQDAMNETRQTFPAEPDTLPPPPPPAPVKIILGQVVVGSVLAAAGGYGVGLLAESFCDDCSADEPGGDTAGILFGVPTGAFLGVWFVGKLAPPPSGRLEDSVLGVLAGTAVFAGYSSILSEQGDLIRWLGVAFPASLGTMGWNRSRRLVRPEVSLWSPEPTGWGHGELVAELSVFSVRF